MAWAEKELPRMMTIREIAKTGIIPEHALRVMVRDGMVPHIKIGSRHLVNFNKVVDILNNENKED